MFLETLSTDMNGFVLFDPGTLRMALGREPAEGEDIYRLFTSSEAGDRAVAMGAVVPVLGITDGGYPVCARDANTASPFLGLPVVGENSAFPLQVSSEAFVADLAVFAWWQNELEWHPAKLPRGFFSVTIRGYRKMVEGTIVATGYEFEATPVPSLPAMTGDLARFIDLGNPPR